MKNLIYDFFIRLFYAFPLDTNIEAKLKTSVIKNHYVDSELKNNMKQSVRNKLITSFRSRSKVSEKITMRED